MVHVLDVERGRLAAVGGIPGSLGLDGRDQLVVTEVFRDGDPRLLVRVAVGDQLAALGDHHRVPLLADTDLGDHSPELFEADRADQPPVRLGERRDRQRDGRRRQQVVVDGDRRDGALAGLVRRRLHGRCAEPACGDHGTVGPEQRQLSEYLVIDHVVDQDLGLLLRFELGVTQMGGGRLQHAQVVIHVLPYQLGRLGRDLEVFLDHRLPAAAAQ